MSRFACAGPAEAIWPGELVAVRLGDVPVVLVVVAQQVCAYVDRCAHMGLAVSEGELSAGVITCPAHHWQYDAATGCGVNPRDASLTRLPVVVRDGQVFVDTEGAR